MDVPSLTNRNLGSPSAFLNTGRPKLHLPSSNLLESATNPTPRIALFIGLCTMRPCSIRPSTMRPCKIYPCTIRPGVVTVALFSLWVGASLRHLCAYFWHHLGCPNDTQITVKRRPRDVQDHRHATISNEKGHIKQFLLAECQRQEIRSQADL